MPDTFDSALDDALISVTNDDMLAFSDEIDVVGKDPFRAKDIPGGGDDMWDLGDPFQGDTNQGLPQQRGLHDPERRVNPPGVTFSPAAHFGDYLPEEEIDFQAFGLEPLPNNYAQMSLQEKQGWWKSKANQLKNWADQNGDGKVNAQDIMAGIKNFVDANDDGTINWKDAMPLIQKVVTKWGPKVLGKLFPALAPLTGLYGLAKLGWDLAHPNKKGKVDVQDVPVTEENSGDLRGDVDALAPMFPDSPFFENPWDSPGDDRDLQQQDPTDPFAEGGPSGLEGDQGPDAGTHGTPGMGNEDPTGFETPEGLRIGQGGVPMTNLFDLEATMATFDLGELSADQFNREDGASPLDSDFDFNWFSPENPNGIGGPFAPPANAPYREGQGQTHASYTNRILGISATSGTQEANKAVDGYADYVQRILNNQPQNELVVPTQDDEIDEGDIP